MLSHKFSVKWFLSPAQMLSFIAAVYVDTENKTKQYKKREKPEIDFNLYKRVIHPQTKKLKKEQNKKLIL